MVGAVMLIVGGLISTALCLVVWRRRKGRGVIISSNTFLAMALGSFAIAAFYVGIFDATLHGHDSSIFIPFSRLLWGFILLSTALIALGVLLQHDGD